jgi:hypothetical protein
MLLGGTGKKARAKPAHFCRLEINGRAVVNGSDVTEQEPIVVSSVRELLEKFPDGFFDDRPDWACVRWIDVEGSNGEVIQFLLKSIDCERSQYFQHVVDRKQRSMGLVMDGPDHETKFLFVLKVVGICGSAVEPRQQGRKTSSLTPRVSSPCCAGAISEPRGRQSE